MIQNDINDFSEFIKDWRNVFKKSSAENMKKIAAIVHRFFKNKPVRRIRNWSPMHIISESGNLELCKYIAEITDDKNPECIEDKWTPLHFAAQAGNFEIYQFLSENLLCINPRLYILGWPL